MSDLKKLREQIQTILSAPDAADALRDMGFSPTLARHLADTKGLEAAKSLPKRSK